MRLRPPKAIEPAPEPQGLSAATTLARSRLLTYWLPIAFKQAWLGSIIDHITGNLAKSIDELTACLDQYGFIAALTAALMYPSLQHAASVCTIIDEQVQNLGTAYLACSLMSAFALFLCAMASSTISLMFRCCTSEAAANYLRATSPIELRLPQQLFYTGILATVCTVLLEALVRVNVQLDAFIGPEELEVSLSAVWAERPGNVAAAVIFAATTLYSVGVLMILAAKCIRVNFLFSADRSTAARQEREALTAGRTAWIASPSVDECRTLLAAYWPSDTADLGPFADPNPTDFQTFMRFTMQARGHGDLSFIACRMADLLFEERVQELLDAKGLKVEREGQLVKPLDAS